MRSDPTWSRFLQNLCRTRRHRAPLIFLTVDRHEDRVCLRSLLSEKKLYLLKLVMTRVCAVNRLTACSVSRLRDGLEHGLDEYEFLGSNEEWKRDWTQENRPHYWLLCFRKVCARAFFTMPSSDWFRSSAAAAVCASPGALFRQIDERPFILGWQTGGIGPRRRAGVSSGKRLSLRRLSSRGSGGRLTGCSQSRE